MPVSMRILRVLIVLAAFIPTARAKAQRDDAEWLAQCNRGWGDHDRENFCEVRQVRMAVYPSSHGQEACQVAAALCLSEGDWMFPTYRDSVAVMARGVDPVQAMTLFRGDCHGGYDPARH